MYEDEDEDLEGLDRGDNLDSEEEEENEESVSDEDSSSEEEDDEQDAEEVDELPAKKQPSIPKARFDQVISQRESLKERNNWLESQIEKLIELNTKSTPAPQEAPAEPDYDFEEAEEKYATLLVEGETNKAAKLRSEIERERDKYYKELILSVKKSALEEATKNVVKVTEDDKFNILITSYENKYAFLDYDSDDYNEDAVDTVNSLMMGYVNKGMAKPEALKKAVEKILPMFEVKAPKTKESLGEKRKVDAGKKAAEASRAQPVKTKTSGTTNIDTTKIDISKMSESDFNKLTAKELKLLRGD